MNLRPSGYEPDELPTALPRDKKMAEDEGFEPPLGFPRLSVFKTDPFSRTWVIFRVIFKLQPYFINYWWTLLDLNQWPSGYEPDALTNWAKGPLIMVAGARFELATFRVWTERSNQLSYPAVKKWWTLSGSNRRPPACKAGALPAELRAHKKNIMVGKTGFEPATLRSQTECSTKLSHFPIRQCYYFFNNNINNLIGAPGGTRTPNLLIRSQTIYPIDLRAHLLLLVHLKI